MPAVPEYQLSGPRLSLLTLITRGRPSLSPPSVSSHALALLLSQAPTGPRQNANKLADLHLVSPHELSHQHSRVMWALLLVMQ